MWRCCCGSSVFPRSFSRCGGFKSLWVFLFKKVFHFCITLFNFTEHFCVLSSQVFQALSLSPFFIFRSHFGLLPPRPMMSLHCQNAGAKKRSIAMNMLLAVRTAMLQQEVHIVAGDFNGAS